MCIRDRHWVLSPVEKFRLGHPDSAPEPQLMTYYVGALNGLSLLFSIELLPAVVKDYLKDNPDLNVGRFFDDMEETKGSKEDV